MPEKIFIDAVKLWENRPPYPGGKNPDYVFGFTDCMDEFSKLIREQIDNPSADVVEVVRCKECAYCYNNPSLNTFRCHRFTAVVDPNHFCSYGERKTMKIRLNPDKETVEAVRSALKETGGYCPCALTKTDNTKCMCKDFREQIAKGIAGKCHCELYEGVLEE